MKKIIYEDDEVVIACYAPKFDPVEFKEMTDKGTKAWADVPDIGAWLEDLRG